MPALAGSTSSVAPLLRLALLLFGALALAVGVATLAAPAAGGDDGPVVEHDDEDDEDEDEDEDEEDEGEIRLEREGPAARDALRIRYVPGELLVKFRPGTSSAEMEDAATRAQGELADHIPQLGVHVIVVSPNRIEEAQASLQSEPSVESVERDVLLAGLDTVPNDALWSTQWGSRLVGAPRAWDSTRGATAVVIAVVDTGVDTLHPDLVGGTVAGRDLVNDDSDPSDDEGHGTSVAGVIAARTNNQEGLAGVCWACSLMPVKVLDSSGWGKTSTIAAGIVWAVDHGARVINMSLGGPGTTSALRGAISYASSKGAVLVAAAGNSGVDTPFYPAGYSEVIGVAATDEADVRYSWSNHGDWVQVAAPGCNTAPRPGGYVEFCGTSSAAPIVSGIAALALSLISAASKSDVEQAIVRSTTPVSDVRFGRVNAPNVISAVSPTGSSTPLQPPPPPPPTPAPAPPAAAPIVSNPAASPPAVAAPVNVAAPRLRGRARVGRRLRVEPGRWNPASVRLAYRWRRCARSGARCRTIRGARRQTYRVTRRDRGHRLRAMVVATNDGGATTVASGASSIVRVARR
jgi:subtilisin family serine protease